MKNIFLKNRLVAFHPVHLAFFLLLITACQSEAVKLTADDRLAIDTLAGKAIKNLTLELDKQCKDSADVMRKRLVDSLVQVRQQEIITRNMPTH